MIKKEFNWEEFLSSYKIAVHCSTKNQAIDFCKKMHEHGLKWKSLVNYLDLTNWTEYKGKTCYTSQGTYSGLDFYEAYDYTILEWSDYTTMKHQEVLSVLLKQGYVIVHEDNTLSKVERNENGKLILSGEVHCCLFADIQEDFSIENDESGTIQEIYGYSDSKHDAYRLSLEGRNCIWERESLKEFDGEKTNRDKLENELEYEL